MTQQMITVPKETLTEMMNRIKALEDIVLKKGSVHEAIETYNEEKKQKKLMKLHSIDELFME